MLPALPRPLGSGARLYGLLAGLLLAAVTLLPVLTRAPNRLLSGYPLPVTLLPPLAIAGGTLALLAALAAGFLPHLSPRGRAALATGAALLLPPLLLAAAGAVAAAETVPLARIALGPGGWAVLGLCLLLGVEAGQRLTPTPWGRALLALLALLPLTGLLIGGALDGLAVMREYAAKREEFAAALLRHGQIVLLALLPTLALGLPLGTAVARRPTLKPLVLGSLGLIQTVPALALFGLLMLPLAALSAAFPVLGPLGISGIGLAPAVLALLLYALLPVVRNMADGLAHVPAATLEAARGMGLSPRQIFWQVELPLALPAILAGVRVTLVQTLGLAAVTALIGAGGLGALLFQGVFANAPNLVLLGALPIIGCALAVDALFRLLAASLTRGGMR